MSKSSSAKLNPLPRGIVLLVDCFLAVVGYYIAYLIRFPLPLPAANLIALESMTPWIALGTMAIFGSMGLYGLPNLDGNQTTASVVVAVGLLELATMASAFWFRSFAFPRTVFGIASVVHLLLLVPWRRFVRAVDKKAVAGLRLLIVSDSSDSQVDRLAQKLGTQTNVGLQVSAGKALAMLEDGSMEFDAALVSTTGGEDHQKLLQRFIALGKPIMVSPSPVDIMMASAQAGQVDDHPILLISGLGLSPGQAFVKRVIDLVLSVMGLLVSLPVLALAAMAVAVSSGTPVLYGQERTGARGATFKVWKLRTMRKDAELDSGPVLATKNDPRVTPVGQILRATRIDEVPQMFNVLRGDMSLVGPRPERPEFVKVYASSIPYYGYRHLVKPGLTGLAQVRGRYSTKAEDKLLYDLTYVANYSLLLDLTIILQTLATLMTLSSSEGVGDAAGPAKVKTPGPVQ